MLSRAFCCRQTIFLVTVSARQKFTVGVIIYELLTMPSPKRRTIIANTFAINSVTALLTWSETDWIWDSITVSGALLFQSRRWIGTDTWVLRFIIWPILLNKFSKSSHQKVSQRSISTHGNSSMSSSLWNTTVMRNNAVHRYHRWTKVVYNMSFSASDGSMWTARSC